MKKTLLMASVASLVLPLALPLTALAQDTVTTSLTTVAAATTTQAVKCDERTYNYLASLTKREAEADAKWVKIRAGQDDNVSKVQANRDTNLATRRLEADKRNEAVWDKKATKHYRSIDALAVIKVYRGTVQSSLTARRVTVDAAITKFRNDRAMALTTRRAAVDAALKTRRAAVDAAFNVWKTRCSLSAQDRAAANQTFRETIKTAREAYRKAVNDAGTAYRANMKTSRGTLNVSLNSALDKYQTEVKAAREILLAALKDID